MTEEQLTAAVEKAIDNKLGQFFVEREQHYLDHDFVKNIREGADKIKGQACKTVTNTIIGGAFLLCLWGLVHFIQKAMAGK